MGSWYWISRRPTAFPGQRSVPRGPSTIPATNKSVDHEEDDYPGNPAQELVAPSDFQPFFTLVEDLNSGEHYHPHVHYIFSDDDPDLLTTSIIDSTHHHDQETGTTQRVVLVDLGTDGRTVERVHGLSPDWQVSQASVSQAPSWNEATPEKNLHGLMLKIDGVGARKGDVERDDNDEQYDDPIAQMESVIAGYGSKLAQLQSLLDAYAVDSPTRVHDDGQE